MPEGQVDEQSMHLCVFSVVFPWHISPTIDCMTSQVLHGRQSLLAPGEVPVRLQRTGSMYCPTSHLVHGKHLGGCP